MNKIVTLYIVALLLLPFCLYAEQVTEEATSAEETTTDPSVELEEESSPIRFNITLFDNFSGLRFIDHDDLSESATKVSNTFGASFDIQVFRINPKLWLLVGAEVSFDIGLLDDQKTLTDTALGDYGYVRYENSLNVLGGLGIYFYPIEKLRIGGIVSVGWNRIALEVDDAIGFGTQVSNGFVIKVKACLDFMLATFGKDKNFFIGAEIAGSFGKVSTIRQLSPSGGIRIGLNL